MDCAAFQSDVSEPRSQLIVDASRGWQAIHCRKAWVVFSFRSEDVFWEPWGHPSERLWRHCPLIVRTNPKLGAAWLADFSAGCLRALLGIAVVECNFQFSIL